MQERNATGSDGPFRTVSRAQRAVRERLASGRPDTPIRVAIRGGVYFLESPLVFGPEDSGLPEGMRAFPKGATAVPVIYAAYPGEEPVVSGGRVIAGWREEKLRGRAVWIAEIPEVKSGAWHFRQLFVNGARRMRPRLPKSGFHWIAELVGARFNGTYQETVMHGADRFHYADGDLHRWHKLGDVEINVISTWDPIQVRIKDLDEENHLVVLDRNSERRMSDDFDRAGGPYYVENVFEALDEPGQWYLDRGAGKLYYLPLPGEEMNTTEVIAPYLPEIMRLEGHGASEARVQSLRFEGITFSHNEWPVPPDMATFHQAASKVPGAVVLRNATQCYFDRCTFEHLGDYALDLAEDCSDVQIVGCDMHDLGAGGVKMRDGCRRNLVSDCEIGPGGLLFLPAVGVHVANCNGCRIIHNHIHHFYQTGISTGWTWGYYDQGGAYGNIVEYNHIHDLGQKMLSDIGGIYNLGVATGTRIRYNVIHDVSCRKYGALGIYLDEGSTDVLVEGNLVYRCEDGLSEGGQRNTFRHNIIALNRQSQLRFYTVSPWKGEKALTFENNIVYWEGADLLYTGKESGPNWSFTQENTNLRGNLYFSANGGQVRFRDWSFGQWQELGQDQTSLIADPLFVDATAGDFRLRPSSPAFSLGFEEPDLTTVGPREEHRQRR
jgi:hypothetical protein